MKKINWTAVVTWSVVCIITVLFWRAVILFFANGFIK